MFQSGKKSKQSDLDFALLLGLEVTTNRDKDKIADNILPSFAFYLWLLKKIKFNCHPRINLFLFSINAKSANFVCVNCKVSPILWKAHSWCKNKLGKFNKE